MSSLTLLGSGSIVSGAPAPAGQLVDLMLIGGQSNAEGRGTTAGGFGLPINGYYYNGSSFSTLADPVGGANPAGSAWPAFSQAWYSVTSGARKTIFVSAGTSLTSAWIRPGTTPTWDPGAATIYPVAIARWNAARAAVLANPAYTLGKVCIVWAQGEAEMGDIDAGTINQAGYEGFLTDLFEAFDDDLDQLDGIFVSELGRHVDGTMLAAHASLRAAQANVCAALPKAHLVWTGAKSLLDNQYHDNQHLGTSGLNAMGQGMVVGTHAIALTWLSGFESGIIPESTSVDTNIATIDGFAPFSLTANNGNKLAISGSTLKLAAALNHHVATSHAFTIRNDLGTSQASSISVSFAGTQVEVFLATTGAGQWTVPAGVSILDSVECIGAGGTGGSNSVAGGGGGGAYAKILNLSVTPAALINYVVGAGSVTEGATGGDTSFNGSSVIAKGGVGGTTSGGAGGSASASTGTTKHSGGAGGSADGTNGGGGGGAAGPNGDGNVGAGAATTSNGGSGDAGSGGAGGTGGAPGSGGAAGTEWVTRGSGGGAGGRRTSNGFTSGGSVAGGGGGGARGGTSGPGAQGIIRIVYTT